MTARRRTLTLYVEVVPDLRSAWRRVRLGRTWTTRPPDGTVDASLARLVRLDLDVPVDMLDPPPDLVLSARLDPPPRSSSIELTASVDG